MTGQSPDHSVNAPQYEHPVTAMGSAEVGGLDRLSYRNDLVDAVLAALSELDIRGTDWIPPEIALLPA